MRKINQFDNLKICQFEDLKIANLKMSQFENLKMVEFLFGIWDLTFVISPLEFGI
jgi:hypothetical protein